MYGKYATMVMMMLMVLSVSLMGGPFLKH